MQTEFPAAILPFPPIHAVIANPDTHPSAGDSRTAVTLRVLLVQDDPVLALSMQAMLIRAGMRAQCAMTGAEAMRIAREFEPQIALLQLELPDMTGISLIKWFCARGRCSVIVVSGQCDEVDRVVALEVGADDYILQPARAQEIVARIHAVHRRQPRPIVVLSSSRAISGGVVLDMAQRKAFGRGQRQIDFTAAEFTIMATLSAALGKLVSRDTLSWAALRKPWRAEDRSVDQLIFTIRKKLAPVGGQDIIQCVRGDGYLLCAAPAALRQ